MWSVPHESPAQQSVLKPQGVPFAPQAQNPPVQLPEQQFAFAIQLAPDSPHVHAEPKPVPPQRIPLQHCESLLQLSPHCPHAHVSAPPLVGRHEPAQHSLLIEQFAPRLRHGAGAQTPPLQLPLQQLALI